MSGARMARPVRLIPTLLSTVLVLTGLSLVAVPPTPAVADPPPPTVSERYADKVMDDGPAAYYRLDDSTAGFARDSSGNFRDGTHGANVTPGVDGAFPATSPDDGALSNAGPDWAFTAPASGLPFGSSSRSIEMWVKTTATSGWLAQYGSRWGIYLSDGSWLRLYVGTGTYSYNHSPTQWPITDGKWHQLVVTFDGTSTSSLYVDGQLLVTAGGGGGLPAGSGLLVGQAPGVYDEVAVYGKELTANEIAGRWAAARMSSTSSVCPVDSTPSAYSAAVLDDEPALYLRGSEAVSEPDSNVVLDHSGSCQHATLGPSSSGVSGAIPGDDDLAVRQTEAGQWAMVHGGAGLPFGSTARSLEMWVNTSSTSEGWLAHYGSRWGIYLAPGSWLRLYVGTGTYSYNHAPTQWQLTDGKWHHLVATFDGVSTSSLYIDGQLLTTAGGGGGLPSLSGLRVGQVPGAYDEVAVYDKELTANEIAGRWAFATMPSTTVCPVASAPSAYSSAVLDDEPALYLRASEAVTEPGSRAVLDHSRHCRHATRGPSTSSTPGDIAGNDDPALRSNDPGTWAMVQGGDGLPFGSTARSLEMWVNTSSTSEGWLAHYGNRWGIYLAPGSWLRLYVGTGTYSYNHSPTQWPITDGKWHHLVATFDGVSTSSLYVDGQLLMTAGGGGGLPAGSGLLVGQVPGAYDEVAVYGKALTANEIAGRWALARMSSTSTCPVDSSPSAYSSAVLDDQPRLYLRGSEAASEPDSKVMLDHSGNCQHGTLGPASSEAPGAIPGDDDPAIRQTAAGQWAMVQGGAGLPFGSTPRSIEMWVNTSSTSEGWLAHYGDRWGVYLAPGSWLRLYVGTGTYSYNHAPTQWQLNDGKWHQVVATYDGAGTSRLYVDGQLLTTAGGGGGLPSLSGLRVGQVPGSYDEVAVYNKALSATEIADRWALGNTGEATGCRLPTSSGHADGVLAASPELYLRLGDALGADGKRLARDASGNCRHGAYSRAAVPASPGALAGNPDGAVSSPDSGQWTVVSGGDGLPFGNSPRSIEMWVKTSSAAEGWLAHYGDRWGIYLAPGSWLRLYVGTGTYSYNHAPTQPSIRNGQWHQLIATYDGTTSRLYFDGQFLIDAGGGAPSSYSGLRVGQVPGAYDDVAVYGRALTAAEIADRWAQSSLQETSLTLEADPDDWEDGEQVTLTATVEAPHPLNDAPTGTVTFVDGSTTLDTVPLGANGKATYTATFSAGNHSIVAKYSGDTRYVASRNRPALDHVVNGAENTTTAIDVQPADGAYGTSFEATATVSGSGAGGASPGGFVVFYVNGTRVGTDELAEGSASVTLPVLEPGIAHVKAVYGGDAVFATSDDLQDVTVTRAPKAPVLEVSPNPAAATEGVRLSVTIPRAGQGTPAATGSVQISSESGPVKTVTLGSNGTATTTVDSLPIGTHTLTASYPGDARYAPRDSAGVEVTVTKATTTTTLLNAPEPAPVGKPVTLTAKVRATRPTTVAAGGTVTFSDGETELGQATLDESGNAQLVVSNLVLGQHQLTASYGGDARNIASVSPVRVQTMVPAVTVTLTAPAVVKVGEQTPIVVTVAPGTGQGPTPTGVVTIKADGVVLGTANLDGTGKGTLITSFATAGGRELTADYPGSSRYGFGSTDSPVHLDVVPAATTTELTSTPNPAGEGAAVTYKATVKATAPGGGVPQGFVVFTLDGTTIATVTLDAAGKASFTDAVRPQGIYQVKATYGGSSSYEPSMSTVLTQYVSPRTETTLTSTPNPSVLGNTVTFTATVDAVDLETVPPGTVSFTTPTSTLGSASIGADGKATITVNDLAVGTYSVVATYSGGSGYGQSSSAPLSHEVKRVPTQVALATAPTSSVNGQTVTLTATVTPDVETFGTPTGSVTFKSGTTTLGTATVQANGKAVLPKALQAGTHSLTASYGGSTTHDTATSDPVEEVVSKSDVTVGVVAAPSPSAEGDEVAVTVTVAPVAPGTGTPSGTVTLKNDGAEVGTATLAAGSTTFQITPTGGDHVLTATYAGDDHFQNAQSANVAHHVGHATTTTLVASPAGSVWGQTVTLTATVASAGGTPSGSVTFKDGTTVLGQSQLNASGVATLQTSDLTTGDHDALSASYTGAGDFAASTSSDLDHTVAVAPTTLSLASSPASPVYGQQVTLTATVAVPTPGRGPPTGFVAFSADGTALGTALIQADGTATLVTNTLKAGTRSLTAVYGETQNHASSTGSKSLAIGRAAPYTFVLSTPNPSVLGTQVTFKIVPDAPYAGTPTGSVTLYDGTTELGTRTLDSNGEAKVTTSALLQGAHQVRAEYSGDDNFLGGSSPTVSHQVNPGLPSSVSLTANPSGGTAFGEQVTFTATVTGNGPPPTGFVTFTDDGQTVGTVTIDSNGQAKLITQVLTVGSHQVGASYGGDGYYFQASAAPVAQEVTPSRQLFFVGQPQELTAGVMSSPYTVRLENRDGPVVAGAGGLVVKLQSSAASGKFFDGSGTQITQVTISAGASTATFRYRDTKAGDPFLATSALASTGVGPRTQQQHVVAGPLDHLALTPASKTVTPGGGQVYQADGRDAWDNSRGDVTDDATFTISPSGSCASSRCTVGAAGDYTVHGSVGAATGTATLVSDNPPVPVLSADVTSGVEALDVTFDIGATDVDGDDLTWTIDYGDGTPRTQPQPLPAGGTTVTHTYLECHSCVAVLHVSDGKADPAPNATLKIDVARNDALFQANAGDPVVVEVNRPAQLDGSASLPGSPLIQTYTWNFGDGHQSAPSANAVAQHTYAAPGDYVATLTIAGHGRTSSSQVPMTVTMPAGGGAVVAVTSGGQPLVGATVVVKDAANATYRAIPTDPGSYRIDGLPDGNVTAYVAAPGYRPATTSISVSGGAGYATLALERGEVGASELTTKRLTPDEAIDLGIDPEAPGNQNIFQFEINLSFEDTTVSVSGVSTGHSFVNPTCNGTECSGGSGWIAVPYSGGGYVVAYPGGDRILWIVIPGQAKWLKEMFDVQLMVTNLSDEAFTFEDGTATLDLPSGLSLADMSGPNPQTLAQPMDDVPGGQSRSVHWIVRGDTEGEYTLDAHYSGVLQPVGTPVQLDATTDEANRIKVWGGSALQMTVDVDDHATMFSPYDLSVSLTNVSDVPVYNPMVTLLPRPQDEHRPYVFQPRQQFDQAVDRIEPGETFTTRDYTVLTDFTGNLNLAQSYILRTGGNQFNPNKIVPHPPDTQVPTMSSTNTSAGIKVSWQPANDVPGETVLGYQVYATPFVSVDFQPTPLAQTDADQLSATIPYVKDGYGVVAVSTLFAGADGKVHNRLDHKALTLGGFSFDIENPCAALGDAPNGGLPGNYVTSSEDLTVNTPGPKLQVTRTYNSSSDRGGWFGTGWSSDYEMASHTDGQGNVAVVLPDGRCLYFMRDPQDRSSFLPPPGEYAHLAADGHDGYVFTSKDRTEFAFDTIGEVGRLQTVTDVDGRRLDLDYGPDPLATKLRTVTDRTTNRSLTFEWNDDGHVSSVSSDPVTTGAGAPAALVWRYYYDDGGRLEAACDPRDNAETGSCTRYQHDPADNEDRLITKVVNPEGNTDAALAYDDKGRVKSRKDGLGQETTYDFPEPPDELDEVVDRVEATSPLGHKTVTDYDKYHRVVSVKTPGGGTTAYEYDTHGYPKLVIDANGNDRAFVYDERGNVLEQTNGEDETTWMTYDTHDNLRTVRDGRSSSASDGQFLTTLSYDAQSHLVEQTAPATSDQPTGAAQTWEYTPGDPKPDGTLVGTKDAIGGGVQPPGLVSAEIDAEGNRVEHEYDRNGALMETLSSTGLVTAYTYDELGRKLSETVTDSSQSPATSATTTYTYDVVGNLLTTTAPSVTNTVTGATHRLRTVSTYDRNDNVTRVSADDLTGGDVTRTTAYTFDANDRVTDITDAEGGITSRRYDADGNVVKVINANQQALQQALLAEYDADSRPTKVTHLKFTDGLGSTPRDVVVARYGYDAGGRRVSVTDPDGRVRQFGYDHADRQVTETLKDYADPDGTKRDVVLERRAYDGAGQVISVTSGGGLRTVAQTWNAAGRLASTVLDPGGLDRRIAYSYDKVGNVLRETRSQDDQIEETRTLYNSVGLPTRRTVENGEGAADDLVTTFGYDHRGNLLTTTDPVGNVTDYRYDVLNRRIAELRPQVDIENVAGTVTSGRPTLGYGFNTFGDATQTVDPRGRTTTTAYDRLGRQTTITHPGYTPPGGQQIVPVERYEYDHVGNLTKVTDRRNLVTEYVFDSMNRVTRQTDPQLAGQQSPGTIGYEYDDAGNLVATVDQRGARREATYDALNQVRTRTDVVRRTGGAVDRYISRYTYDDLGNLLTEENPLHDLVRYGYSPASEVVSVTDEAGKVTIIDRDVAGRAVRTTDPLGRARVQQYDDAGRLTSVAAIASTGAEQARTRFDLDKNGNVIQETRPENNTTGFSYDSNGRLTRVDQPTAAGVTATTKFGYDAAGNQTRLTDGGNNMTAYTYTSWNLREDTVEPSTSGQTTASSRTFTTSYDAAGLPVKETQPNGITIDRTFDELGNLVVEKGASTDATIADARRDFSYDKAGVLSSAGPATARIDFAFDDRGLLTSATGASGNSSYQYDAAGQLLSRTDASGTSNFTWDARGNLNAAQDPLTGVTATNTYDDASQLASTSYSGGASRALTWDQQGRLTADTLKKSDGSITSATTYGYDKNDNLKSQTITQSGNSAAGAHTYTYDLADRLASWTKGSTTKNYTYDAAGNLAKVGNTVYNYDARNRLTGQGLKTYSWDARGTLAKQSQLGVPQAVYEYDALGRTTKVTSSSFQPIPLTYDSLDRVTSRRGVAFAYEGTNIDPVSDGSTLISRAPSGAPMAQKTGTGTPSLTRTNRHGDLTALFSGNGTVNGSRVYEPYGDVAGTTGTASPLGFQSDYTDPTTHDVWMGARWYLPDVGSFTARDTVAGQLKTPVTLNRYTYGSNDPLGMFDADGRWGNPITALSNFVGGVWGTITAGWNAVTGFISGVANGISSVYGMAQSVYNAARAKVSAAISRAQQQISHMIDVARRAGAAYMQQHAALAKILKQGADIILPMVAGAVVTGGCMYATAGAATPACLMAGGATAGALSGASHCDGMNSACVRRVLVEASAGAVTGLFGGSGGSVLRSAGRMLAGAEGAGLRTAARQATVAAERSTLLGNFLRGGTENAVYDSVVQIGTTGTIDFKQVGESFVSGAVLAGALHLGASGARGLTPTRHATASEMRGPIHWVDEGGNLREGGSPGMRPDAYAYQSGTTGARSNPDTGKAMAPQLRMPGRDGATTTAKFDGVDGAEIIDRKLNVVWSAKMVDEARRQAGVAAYNGYQVVWELPTQKAADAAQRFLLTRARISTITVRVAP